MGPDSSALSSAARVAGCVGDVEVDRLCLAAAGDDLLLPAPRLRPRRDARARTRDGRRVPGGGTAPRRCRHCRR